LNLFILSNNRDGIYWIYLYSLIIEKAGIEFTYIPVIWYHSDFFWWDKRYIALVFIIQVLNDVGLNAIFNMPYLDRMLLPFTMYLLVHAKRRARKMKISPAFPLTTREAASNAYLVITVGSPNLSYLAGPDTWITMKRLVIILTKCNI
jgi:hypothetical protein